MTRAQESRIDAILEARTRALAARIPAQVPAPDVRIRVAALRAHDLYGIALNAISHIVPFARAQAGSPAGSHAASGAVPGLHGLIGLRGQVYNVVNLMRLLHPGAPHGEGEDGHLVVLRERLPRVALLCTRVEAVVDLLPAQSVARDGAAIIAFHGRVMEKTGALYGESVAVLDLEPLLHMISHTGELRP